MFVHVGPPLYTPIVKKLFGGGNPSHSKARASKARAHDTADTASSRSKAWGREGRAAQPFQKGAQGEDPKLATSGATKKQSKQPASTPATPPPTKKAQF